MRSAASQKVTNISSSNLVHTALDAEFCELVARVTGPEPAELTPGEYVRLSLWFRGQFRSFENQYYQHRQGFLEDLWPGYHNNLSTILAIPFIRDWWRENRGGYGPQFQAFVDREFDATPVDPVSAASMIRGGPRP